MEKLSLHAVRGECLMGEIQGDQDGFGREDVVAEDGLSGFWVTADVELCVRRYVANAGGLVPGRVCEWGAEGCGCEVVSYAAAHDA